MKQKSAYNSRIRDNRERGNAGEFIESELTPGTDLSIVSAYFTVHAYGALSHKLERINGLRFLFGDPSGASGNLGRDLEASREFSVTENGLNLENQLKQSGLARECARWIKDKVKIRSVSRTGFLHGKMYHLQNDQTTQALLGSSNFTVPGLGLGSSKDNVELNLIIDNDRDRADLLTWFNEWWKNDECTKDVKNEVLQELSRVYSNRSPEFIYYLTLFNIFKKYLDQEKDTEDNWGYVRLPDTLIWKALYGFQKDAANSIISRMRNLNGCILADSVGLGKTYTALAIIKYFELKRGRVLVICPKKLNQNWMIYRNNVTMNPFVNDKFEYDVLAHTDLSRRPGAISESGVDIDSLMWENYNLVVIDESHNFRNNKKARQIHGEERRMTRYEKLLNDVIKSGVNTKVLLISATPVNNDLSDLRNQLSIIAGGDVTKDIYADGAFSRSLHIRSVRETTHNAQQVFSHWAKRPLEKRNRNDLLTAVGADFFALLDGVSIARSRKQISRSYKHEMEQLGGFPKRARPDSCYPQISCCDNQISFKNLSQQIEQLTLALYYPTGYLRDDLDKQIYDEYQNKMFGGFTQERREGILIGMMKVNFLKRLESSVDSFRLTLSRTIEKIDERVEMLEKFEKHREGNPEVEYETIALKDIDDPELEDDNFMVGGKRKFHLGHINSVKWRNDMLHDRDKLSGLLKKMKNITVSEDAKLGALWERIYHKFSKPTMTIDKQVNRKVLVFTAYVDTAKYLYRSLHDRIQLQNRHLALVCGSGENETTIGKKDYDSILTNFSPISKRREEQSSFLQREEIDVLIATDCISEGQNLQDCDLVINYDIHWNPVRIIQRFGRIDRIGSRNGTVYLTNFWPVKDLDQYLNVKDRVESRMALVDLSASQSDNLLAEEQLEELASNEIQLRNQQILQMQNAVLDIEDLDEGITLSNFSLEEFRIDLFNFLETRRKELEAAPLGMYAVVPPKMNNSTIGPGVLFCLHQRGEGELYSEELKVNPLGRYYLIYLHDDGTVRLTFMQPKRILEIWQGLSIGHHKAFEKLCDAFDEVTQSGINMEHYSFLIQKALASIQQEFWQRAERDLYTRYDATLPAASAAPADTDDGYDLVTWLVILKAPNHE